MNRKQTLPAGRQGFTLLELLLVMVILGVLLVIGVGTFFSSLQKGRDTTRKTNIRSITSALELYYNDKGKYPVWNGAGSIPGCYNAERSTGLCGADYPTFEDVLPSGNIGAIWMAKFPVDPVSGQTYYYVSDALGKQYQIYAHLENSQDPQCLLPNCASNGLMCGTTAGCNYGISSANTNP